jgi:hypothetical protein
MYNTAVFTDQLPTLYGFIIVKELMANKRK